MAWLSGWHRKKSWLNGAEKRNLQYTGNGEAGLKSLAG